MSLRLVRSPDAPKITMTQGSPGRPAPGPATTVSSATCIVSILLSYVGRRPRLPHCRQAAFYIVQMDPQSAAVAFGQHLEIAASLRCFHHTESILLAGYSKVDFIVTGDLQEDARGIRGGSCWSAHRFLVSGSWFLVSGWRTRLSIVSRTRNQQPATYRPTALMISSLAAATTSSGVNPNFFCSSFSGADAPNVCIPMLRYA